MDSRSISSDARVAVFGAAGHTGRFVVAELAARGLVPIGVTRDGRHPGGATGEWRSASIGDPDSLERAFSGVRAVINCAGPFLDTARPVAQAAIRAGSHYLDVTAEQGSARQTLDECDAAARSAGVVVIPAMGFYGGFADLLVTAAMREWAGADAIDILIGLDSWHPTAGTRLTGQRNTVPRVVISGGRLVAPARPPAERTGEFALPIGRQALVEVPFSETILIARHKAVGELHTYLSRVALDDLRNEATPAPVPADATGRSAQHFEVRVPVQRGGETRRMTARGRDIYGFSAPLVCAVAEELLAGRFARPGAHAPGAVLQAREILESLVPGGLELEAA